MGTENRPGRTTRTRTASRQNYSLSPQPAISFDDNQQQQHAYHRRTSTRTSKDLIPSMREDSESPSIGDDDDDYKDDMSGPMANKSPYRSSKNRRHVRNHKDRHDGDDDESYSVGNGHDDEDEDDEEEDEVDLVESDEKFLGNISKSVNGEATVTNINNNNNSRNNKRTMAHDDEEEGEIIDGGDEHIQDIIKHEQEEEEDDDNDDDDDVDINGTHVRNNVNNDNESIPVISVSASQQNDDDDDVQVDFKTEPLSTTKMRKKRQNPIALDDDDDDDDDEDNDDVNDLDYADGQATNRSTTVRRNSTSNKKRNHVESDLDDDDDDEFNLNLNESNDRIDTRQSAISERKRPLRCKLPLRPPDSRSNHNDNSHHNDVTRTKSGRLVKPVRNTESPIDQNGSSRRTSQRNSPDNGHHLTNNNNNGGGNDRYPLRHNRSNNYANGANNNTNDNGNYNHSGHRSKRRKTGPDRYHAINSNEDDDEVDDSDDFMEDDRQGRNHRSSRLRRNPKRYADELDHNLTTRRNTRTSMRQQASNESIPGPSSRHVRYETRRRAAEMNDDGGGGGGANVSNAGIGSKLRSSSRRTRSVKVSDEDDGEKEDLEFHASGDEETDECSDDVIDEQELGNSDHGDRANNSNGNNIRKNGTRNNRKRYPQRSVGARRSSGRLRSRRSRQSGNDSFGNEFSKSFRPRNESIRPSDFYRDGDVTSDPSVSSGDDADAERLSRRIRTRPTRQSATRASDAIANEFERENQDKNNRTDFLANPMALTDAGENATGTAAAAKSSTRPKRTDRYSRHRSRRPQQPSSLDMYASDDDMPSHAPIEPMQVDVNLSWDDIGGLDHHVRALKEMVFLPLLYPEVFEKFSMEAPKGVLFYGPPGTGKTLCARALAASCGAVEEEEVIEFVDDDTKTTHNHKDPMKATDDTTKSATADAGTSATVRHASTAGTSSAAAAGNAIIDIPTNSQEDMNDVEKNNKIDPPSQQPSSVLESDPNDHIERANGDNDDINKEAPNPPQSKDVQPNNNSTNDAPDEPGQGNESGEKRNDVQEGDVAPVNRDEVADAGAKNSSKSGTNPNCVTKDGNNNPDSSRKVVSAVPGLGSKKMVRTVKKKPRVAFFMRNGADCLSKWVGEAERQLRMTFEAAKRHQPAIIFFDEIDGLAPVRSSKQDQIHSSIVSTLLGLMDGLDARGKIVVIGATNRVDAIDPALRRPGRFDRELIFTLPNHTARRRILDIHTSKWAPAPKVRVLDAVAKMTVGYCGADLKALCSESAICALRRRYPQVYTSNDKLLIDVNQVRVGTKDFLSAMSDIVPASHRSAKTFARPLPQRLLPVLGEPFNTCVNILRKIFPQGFVGTAGNLNSNKNGGGNPNGNGTMVNGIIKDGGSGVGSSSNADALRMKNQTQSSNQFPMLEYDCLTSSDEDDNDPNDGSATKGIDMEAMESLVFNAGRMRPGGSVGSSGISSTIRQQSLRPRVLICGYQGLGQAQLGPALLHLCEGCPVHAIDLSSLVADLGARSPEEALLSAFREAARSVPSILYLPHLQLWWASASQTLQTSLIIALKDVPADLPLLVLATAEEDVNALPSEAVELFGQVHELSGPQKEARQQMFAPIVAAAKARPRISEAAAKRRRRKRVMEVLPKAPPPKPKAPSTEELAHKIENEERYIRMLRMEMREFVEMLLRDRRYKPFWTEVDVTVAPDYYEIIKIPMDIQKIAASVDKGLYPTVLAMVNDFDIMVKNAIQYNPPNTEVGAAILRRAHGLIDVVHAWVDNLNPTLVDTCNRIIMERVARQAAAEKETKEKEKSNVVDEGVGGDDGDVDGKDKEKSDNGNNGDLEMTEANGIIYANGEGAKSGGVDEMEIDVNTRSSTFGQKGDVESSGGAKGSGVHNANVERNQEGRIQDDKNAKSNKKSNKSVEEKVDGNNNEDDDEDDDEEESFLAAQPQQLNELENLLVDVSGGMTIDALEGLMVRCENVLFEFKHNMNRIAVVRELSTTVCLARDDPSLSGKLS